MPRNDIIQCLRPERGSSVSLSKTDDNGHNLLVCAYRDRKAKVLISSCSTTQPSTQSYEGNNDEVLRRPNVFEDYESHKSKILSDLFQTIISKFFST